MKVVVTGGSGQLGTLVLDRLVADRKIKKIVSLDLVPPAVPSARIDWRIADLRDPGLERYMEGADALVHLAFVVMPRATVETMYAVNVDGSRRLFAAAAQHSVGRIVYASSVAAYGTEPTPGVIDETTPRRRSPSLPHADNKYEVEEHLDAFEMSHPHVTVVRLRPGVLLGRRMSIVTPGFLRKRVLPVVGDVRVPIVWDEDVADAVVRALYAGAKGAYNLVASDPIAGAELARLAGFRPFSVPRAAASAATRASSVLAPLLGERRFDAGWLDVAEIDLRVSSEKARTELGWTPRHTTSAEVAIAFGGAAPRATDRRIALFFSMAARFAKQAADDGTSGDSDGLTLALHIDVTGPAGGDFSLVLEDGKVTLKSGILRPPTSRVTLSADTLLELLSGKTDVTTAALVGKIEVRGEPMGGALLGGIIDGFRRMTDARGVRGRVARGFSRWLEQGGRR
ncbi:MAG TPA: NAD-dependent epimerase/dehydratase family protein [Polyangiaceae bacterium]|nr:NAD-dependent epimerase/dehydratase family protein [Polyangiaceae bacterium]